VTDLAAGVQADPLLRTNWQSLFASFLQKKKFFLCS